MAISMSSRDLRSKSINVIILFLKCSHCVISHGMYNTIKRALQLTAWEKNTAESGTSWTLCRSAVPWRCTTIFRLADRLCLLEIVPSYFPIPCPRQGSRGREISAPILVPRGHVISLYLYHNVAVVSSMWYILKRFEEVHVLKLI